MKRFICAILLFAIETSFALSPPWYSLQRELANSFGAGPWVEVGELNDMGDYYLIYVIGRIHPVAEGLAFVLPEEYIIGNIRVLLVVLYADGTEVNEAFDPGPDPRATARRHFFWAMFGNPYFSSAVWGGDEPLRMECTPDIIQFWNDDISDPNGYVHHVAADVFNGLIEETYFDGYEARFFTGLKIGALSE